MRTALSFVVLLAGMFGTAAEARLTRIEAEAPMPVAAKDGTPSCEIVTGVFHGELDPQDPANRITTDIAKAPRNKRGMVEYSANFSILRPVAGPVPIAVPLHFEAHPILRRFARHPDSNPTPPTT